MKNLLYSTLYLKWQRKESSSLKNREKKRLKKNEQNLSDLWDNFKHTNLHVIGI